MIGVDEVGVPILFGSEGQDPTVSAALVEILRAVVGARFEGADLGDLRFQSAEGCLDLLHLRGAGGVLELEGNNVAEMTVVFGRCGGVRHGWEGEGEKHRPNEHQRFH